jgi:hypothetical protein
MVRMMIGDMSAARIRSPKALGLEKIPKTI